MADLLIEIFPIEAQAIPPLVAYRLLFAPNTPTERMTRIGGRVTARLRRIFPRDWLWFDGLLITDDIDRNPIEVLIAVDELIAEHGDTLAELEGVDVDVVRDMPPLAIAEAMNRIALKPLQADMQVALEKFNTRLRNARVERESKAQSWSVHDQPALSISIASRMIYNLSLQEYIGKETELSAVKERVVGMWVTDGEVRGEVVQIVGRLGDLRDDLLADPPLTMPAEIVERSPDADWVVLARIGRSELPFLARGVRLIVRLPQINRFDVDAKQAIQALQLPPKERVQQVKAVSAIPQNAGLIKRAYNSRTAPELFFSADFEMNLRFKDNRVRPYAAEMLPDDFRKLGAYKIRDEFQTQPIRLCVVNTLTMAVEDFVEAMRRQLDKHFTFKIDVVRERKVRVVNRNNLESAVRVVEKENPDLILAFFRDEIEAGDDEESGDDATAAYVKSLTLGRGLPTHVIYQSTLDDPEAMTGIILSILGKTGSAPFVLTEPIESADYVVGLDIVRQSIPHSANTRITAIARVYRADGEFLHYAVREMELEEDKLPFVLMRDLFPQKRFAKQRIMIHHTDAFTPDLLTALKTWGQAIGASFYPVEIIRHGAPRLYAIGEFGAIQPEWGSAFKLSEHSAVLVSSLPKDDITPQPLLIRTVSAGAEPLPIEEALRSILVWTLLTYGAERLPKLPVTVVNTDQLGEWLSKGNKFSLSDGDVPFWL